MANCPLCSDVLLRHVRSKQTYWFCRRCRVEILEKSEQTAYQHSVELSSREGSASRMYGTHFKSGVEELIPHKPLRS